MGVIDGFVQTTDGKPISCFSIRLDCAAFSKPFLREFQSESGFYRFDTVPVGRCQLRVYALGYSWVARRMEVVKNTTSLRCNLKLSREITLRVAVLDAETSKPVHGATVCCVMPLVVSPYRQPTRQERTNTAGVVTIPGLSPGTWIVQVTHEHRLNWESTVHLVEGQAPRIEANIQKGGAVRVELDADMRELSHLGRALVMPQDTWVELPPCEPIESWGIVPGTVTATTCVYTSSAMDDYVVLHGTALVRTGLVSPIELRPVARSGISLCGRVMLGDQVLEGALKIRPKSKEAWSAWFPEATCSIGPEGDYRSPATFPGRADVTVMPNAIPSQTTLLIKDVRISNTPECRKDFLFLGSVQGQVTRESDGTPLPGVSVSLSHDVANSTASKRYASTSTTDTEGRYFLIVPEAGRYSIEASPPPFLDLPDLKNLTLSSEGPIAIQESGDRTVDLALADGGQLVVELDPIDDADLHCSPVVYLYPIAKKPPTHPRSAAADEYLIASFDGIPAGEYLATCAPSAASNSARINVNPGTSANLRLSFRPATQVFFDTKDEHGNLLLASLELDAETAFTIALPGRIAYLAAGEYRVKALHNGYKNSRVRFRVQSEREKRVSIVMSLL